MDEPTGAELKSALFVAVNSLGQLVALLTAHYLPHELEHRTYLAVCNAQRTLSWLTTQPLMQEHNHFIAWAKAQGGQDQSSLLDLARTYFELE